MLDRERALISGHADIEFTGWIVMSAATETELDAATKQIERAASQAAVRHACCSAAKPKHSSRQRSQSAGSRCEWRIG